MPHLLTPVLAFAGGAMPSAATTLPTGFTETQIGGTWNEAVGLLFEDNGRMYVGERAGRVWIVEGGVKRSTPLIDLSEEVGGWHEVDGFEASNGEISFVEAPDAPDAPRFFRAVVLP